MNSDYLRQSEAYMDSKNLYPYFRCKVYIYGFIDLFPIF